MKSARHALILKIIGENNIETQEELVAQLQAQGCNATQATISRDIKELRLVKVMSLDGTYKYATVDKADRVLTNRFIRVFAEAVISVARAKNLIVIKTMAGSAHAAANTIDTLNWPEIVGCVAGDDTILVVAQDDETAEGLTRRFEQLRN